MVIRSKYLKELFIQCQLPFFPFPLLMMLCLVNFLFPQVEGIKWTCRGSLHKINSLKCWYLLNGLQMRSVILIFILTGKFFYISLFLSSCVRF